MTITDTTRYEEVADEYGYPAEAFIAYCDNHHIKPEDAEDAIDGFHESYIDEFPSHASFVRQYMFERDEWNLPDYIVNHVDWNAVFEQELRHDFWESDGYYFANI